jgi:hypothetical protein
LIGSRAPGGAEPVAALAALGRTDERSSVDPEILGAAHPDVAEQRPPVV